MQEIPPAKRRRRRKRRSLDSSVASPCVAVCRFMDAALDDTEICAGCYRTPDEIREWMIMTREEKLDVLSRISLRRQEAR